MASGGSRQQAAGTKQQQAADQELDPSYDWQDNTTNFVLRVHLPADLRKQDFKVQVDGAGRLTVRGQRAGDATAKHYYRLNKVFQLPATSNLDDITGRFEAGLLTLTVPKKQTASITTPAAQLPQPQEPAKKQAAQPAEADATRNPPPPPSKEDQMDTKKQPDAAGNKPTAAAVDKALVDDGKRIGGADPVQDQSKAAAPPATSSAAPPVAADNKNQQQPAAPPPPLAAADKQPQAERKAADPDSLAERVKRRAEEEDKQANYSKARPAAAAAEEAPRRRGFRERVAEELQGLPRSEWAEGLVDTVRNNREVIAVAVAAFSIGFFVSSRLFSRASN